MTFGTDGTPAEDAEDSTPAEDAEDGLSASDFNTGDPSNGLTTDFGSNGDTKVMTPTLNAKIMDASTNHVAVKAPEFTMAAPTGWFTIMEAQFVLAKIVEDSTKFYHCLSHLPPKCVENVPETVLEKADYPALKEFVIQFYQKSKHDILEEFISRTPLTLTEAPSQWLRKLQREAGRAGLGDDAIRHKFLSALPHDARMALVAHENLDLGNLAALADTVIKFSGAQGRSAQPSINEVSAGHGARAPAPPRQTEGNGKDMLPIGLRPFKDNQRPLVCRSHLYYGAAASSCRPWCKFPRAPGLEVARSRPGSPAPARDRAPEAPRSRNSSPNARGE